MKGGFNSIWKQGIPNNYVPSTGKSCTDFVGANGISRSRGKRTKGNAPIYYVKSNRKINRTPEVTSYKFQLQET